ncbi:MAG: tRNA-dihydrouridine synthase family protein [bacterium]|nr:tRNA-dihydrouridine synthase family protein [bacterium]
MQSLWQNLKKPIIGLSPMDGITDYAFREIHAKYGKPDIMLTEFTNVEGMFLGNNHLFNDLLYSPLQGPMIAQIFGSTPEYFYKAAIVCCELGFDGIDINMGCPAKTVAHLGGGAALIAKPKLAQEIIYSVKQGVADWSNGKKVNELGLDESKLALIESMKSFAQIKDSSSNRMQIPVSVKTRIGVDEIVIEDWVQTLLETEVQNISIHGRTLKQMYSGKSNWEAIAKAAIIIKQTRTTVLGNGDIESLPDAHNKIKEYNVDGVLIGRSAMGNPFLWQNKTPNPQQKLNLALEHAQIHSTVKNEKMFLQMRKHFSFYISNYYNSTETKIKLLQTSNFTQAHKIITKELDRIAQEQNLESENAFSN